MSIRLVAAEVLIALTTLGIRTTDSSAEPPPNFMFYWGGRPSADPGSLDVPNAVDIAANGSVCVLEYGNQRIQLFTSTGDYLMHWPVDGSDLEIAPTGDIYVADTVNHRVRRFSRTGTLILEWGSLGTEEGEFNGPRGIAVDPDGLVYVADTGNYRIQKFDAIGQFLTAWGGTGESEEEVGNVRGLAIDESGNLFAADAWGKVRKFSLDGSFQGEIGSYGGSTPADGAFYRPEALDVDSYGNVFVLDRWARRIQKFGPDGGFLSKWGEPGGGNGELCNPTGIAVSRDGSTIYVTDVCTYQEPHQDPYNWLNRVEKFEYGATPVRPSSWGRMKNRYRP